MLEWLRFIICALLLISGLSILTIAVIGIYRFKFVLNRMHASAMGDTLGLLFSMLCFIVASDDIFIMLKFLLIIVFYWVASPVGTHLIARLEITSNENLSKVMEDKR